MQLPQILKHYKLDSVQLIRILIKNEIHVDLRLIRQVPEEWMPLLSEATGIEAPVFKIKELVTGGQRLGASEIKQPDASKIAEPGVEEVLPTGNKADTIKGLTVLGKINLRSNSEKGVSERKAYNSKHTKIDKKNQVKGDVKKDYFWAYVKFVVPEKNYGFVKRIDNLNSIDPNKLTTKEESDYHIKLANNQVRDEQLILCSSISEANGRKQANIEAIAFKGIIKDRKNQREVFDLSSQLCPQGVRLPAGSLQKYKSHSFLSFTLNITLGKIQAKELGNSISEPELNEIGNLTAFKELAKKESLTEDELGLIQVVSKAIQNREEIVKIYQERFNQEMLVSKVAVDESLIHAFLNKWLALCPDLLTKSNLELLVDDSFYFNRWLQGQMPVSFWGDKIDNICWGYLSLKNPQEALSIVSNLKNILKENYESDFTKLISRYCQNIDTVSSAEEFIHLKKILEVTPDPVKNDLELELLSKLAPLVKLELWLEGKTNVFPKAEAVELFSTCLIEQQEKIIDQLDIEEFKLLLKYFTPSNRPSTLQRARQIVENEVFQRLNPISLDIESDGTEIYELAWGNGEEWVSGVTAEDVEALNDRLQNVIQTKEPLLVGHNILDFDIPVLEKKTLSKIESKAWDTLLVEMLLSPGLRTFSLKTSHHALEDAKLALQLFKSQILRIINLDEATFQVICGGFHPALQKELEEVRVSFGFSWLLNTEAVVEHLSFLRPQPNSSSLVRELADKITASNAKVKVILASPDFMEELRTIPNIQYKVSGNDYNRFKELNRQLVFSQLVEGSLELLLAESFFHHCDESGIRPLLINLPPIVRVKLSEKIDLATSVITHTEHVWDKEQITCLDILELAKVEKDLLGANDLEFFVVEPDLISLTFKSLLKEFDLAYIMQNPVVKHLWIKFSGGQSFIELARDQVIGLEVQIPEGINNFWIEKYVYGKYRIWGNYSWEKHLAGFSEKQINIINREKISFARDQANYVVVDQKKTQKDIGITRFNPESIYRSRYWVIQKELVEGIVIAENDHKPLVLLIQRVDELDTVQQYFQSIGYYIPSKEASLSRRLELLHQNNNTRKVLVATVSEASQILDANYLGSLNVVLDCFNLYESYYLTKGTELFNKSITESAELVKTKDIQDEGDNPKEDYSGKVEPTDNNLFLQRDFFFLLSLQIPYINRLRSLLLDDNADNKLWLLDARIEDFSLLTEKWNAKKVVLNVWGKKDAYDSDAKVADACILSPKPDNELPFSIEDAKDILGSVFLPENASWHDYQVPYLDKILAAQNNILVSLPTGGGKSLLFQAPALYRSSFTNRLTIVITPLKALMEDQVKALWDLGFYGSVEYLNQDKSDEVLHIYRRLAGGEISLLFITPERFRSGGFVKAFIQRFDNDGGLEYAVYDEAHCISQWGHEFRPDYLYSGKSVQRFKDMCERKFPVLLFSATVSEKIYRDLNLIFK
jgi:hypothetical protein